MTNWSWSDDPNLDSEAKKYENPIPSRDYILELLEERGHPLTHRQICAELGIHEEDMVEAVRRRLKAMERWHNMTVGALVALNFLLTFFAPTIRGLFT